MAMAETMMTPEDLANFLGVPVATLYRWRHQGDGPRAYKVGRHLRWRRADVEQWLDLQSNQGEAAAQVEQV
jgi:excisionase family DNA binding protein